MNSENFHEYLKNPSMLHQVSYQELKSLMMQYPFSPNLRYLLLLKSLMDHHKEYERNLSAASVYSIDRKKLWHLMKQYASLQASHENYALTEDYLELKDLSVIEDILQDSQSDSEETPLVHQIKPDLADPAPHDFEDMSDQELQAFFQEEEGLDFLEEMFDEPDTAESGHPAPNPEQDPQSGEHSENTDQPLPDEVEALGSTPEPDEATNDLPGEMPGLDENFDYPARDLNESTHSPDDEEFDQINDLSEPAFDIPETPATAQPENHQDTQDDEAGENEETIFDETLANSSPPIDGRPTEDESPLPASQKPIPFEITNNNQDQEAITNPEASAKRPLPIPKDSFNSWLQKLRPPKVSIHKIKLEPRAGQDEAEKEENDTGDVKQIAQKSLSEDQNIATETLATVLAMQGHNEKAIAMYERLSLQYPEKSSFFAAKIKELKK
ncbi:MAG: hypothetical protein H6577_25600 [Lewinellaceae bacterium]|nr:hypothetical protein [Saprospiraceae bacterium]MCB9341512.1 hypothetical protein [Lewinellaceae bacterium]